MRNLYAAALVLALGTAGCGASGGSPDVPLNGSSPGQATPAHLVPAGPVPAKAIPAHAGLYTRIPRACSALDAATLRAIAPGSSAGTETDARVPGGNALQHVCDWYATGPGWTRNVTVQVELETGDGARVNAADEYQTETSFPSGARRAVRGLGDQAQLITANLKAGSSAQLHILQRNVIITVVYIGEDAGGAAITPAELRDGTMAAAYSVLASLR